MLNNTDTSLLKAAIALAHSARQHGNHPFGALLADEKGIVLLQAENTVVTSGDCTGHAETNLMRAASQNFPASRLAAFTLFTSTEPCPMCAGAIFWGGVGRVVFALSQAGLYALTGDSPERILLSCEDVLSRAGRQVEVIGPALEDKARLPHLGFWT